MKKLNIISMALCAMMGTATLTSCEGTLDDVFGEWSRPTKTEPTLSIEETPLSIEAVEAGTIQVIYQGDLTLPKPITYTKNGVSTSITATTDIAVAAGDVVSFSSENSRVNDDATGWLNILADHKIYVYGNVMSLINDEGDFSKDKTISGDYALAALFQDNAQLYNHPEKKLLLPATTLYASCYYKMFYNCTSLTTAPELPATTMADNCYYYMFYGCTSLKTAPELPATTLATRCYLSMFQGCSSLKIAPELPATTLATRCYYTMFYKCSGLETAPVLPATTLAEKCYYGMFMYCPKLSSVSCKATSGMNTTNLAFWLDYAGSDATSPTLHVTNGKKLEEWNLPSSVTWTVVDDL